MNLNSIGMNELVKAFNHIARDIMIYILPGLIFLLFCLFFCIKIHYLNSWNNIMTTKNIIILIIVAYIIGHIIMGIMEFFVILKIENFFKKIFYPKESIKPKDENDAELEILAFSDRDAYNFFVERHTQLSLFRWNLSGSFFLISISSFIFLFFYYDFVLICIGVISIIFFLIMFVFSIKTELDGHCRRKILANKKKS